MPTPTRANNVARLCLLVGLVIWMAEIVLRRKGKLTIDQFTASMLIPIGIMAYGLFVRWSKSSAKLSIERDSRNP